MISTVSRVVRRLRGWGEKITASRHLSANIPTPGGVSSGLVVGTSDAITPTGFAYLTIPRSGSSSMTPTLGWRSTSRRMPITLSRLPTRLTGSPMPLSSTPIAASRVKVSSLATAQATAWHSRSTSACVAPSNSRSAARAAHDQLVDRGRLLRGDRSGRHRSRFLRMPDGRSVGSKYRSLGSARRDSQPSVVRAPNAMSIGREMGLDTPAIRILRSFMNERDPSMRNGIHGRRPSLMCTTWGPG